MYKLKQKMAPYLFLLPNIIIFSIFVIFPAFYGIYISFTEWDVLTKPEFIGLSNYIKLLNDARFWDTFGRTFVYVAVAVPLTFLLSMGLALMLNRRIRARGLFRAVFYLPAMLSFIIIGVSWQWLLGDNFGVVNYILELIGLQSVRWLTTPVTATIMVIIATVWARAGYYMVMFLSGLQGIPESYYEAANIDGANKWQQFIHITFPLLKPTSLIVVVLNTIEVFKMYGLVHSMTTGGPGKATTFIVQDIYTTAFGKGNMGYAATMSMVLFVTLGLLTMVYFKINKKGGNAYE